jgi:PucR family transcriptional regulator, purine catabolism regulatory protein
MKSAEQAQQLIAAELTTPPTNAAEALARIDALHAALTQIVLEGGNLSRIAAEVAGVLDVGVLITSTDGREKAAALPEPLRDAMDDAELFDLTGRFRVERVDADGARVGKGQVRMLPVVAGGTDLARLVCFRESSVIAPDDVHAMERAAAVAALLITREDAVTAVENKYQGDFLRDVFLRRAGAEEYVVEHVEAFGWNLDRDLVVVAAEIDPPAPEEPVPTSQVRRRWQERFSAAWRQVSAGFGDGIPSVDFSSEVVTLVPAELSVRNLVEAVAGDKGGGRRSFSVGVSRVATSIGGLPDAYAQARRAVEVGRRIHGRGSTTLFDELGVHRLIALVPDPAELRTFAHDVLGELANGTPEAADLRETLQVLLDKNFNVAEAARAQFFHYNTMRYRVGKLERLLGPVASDPHLRLDVAVALRVLEIAP